MIIYWILSLRDSNPSGDVATTSDNTFRIWLVWDSRDDFTVFLDDFKQWKPEYENVGVEVESFSDYEEYYYALTSAITSWVAPDIFVLNNNEKEPIFSSQVYGIDSSIINPNDFRKKYKAVFWDDLILSYTDAEWKPREFLAWVPVWYESLGIFYNRRYVKSAELSSLSSLNNAVSALKDRFPNLIPIGIWNGSTVLWAHDIVTQFFMLESWVSSLADVTGNKLKQSLASYFLFWDDDGENGYNSRFVELTTIWNNNLDLFSQGETFMVVWYPRMIEEIDERWFSKNFLRAEPFPHYFSWQWKTLINYNYFVINKQTQKLSLASDLLLYLTSDIWASSYLSSFPYYLPALLSLESEKREEKIHPDYNIVLRDFHNTDFELSSFDKGIKNLYNRDIISILDNASNYQNTFDSFRTRILCKSRKFSSLENLSGNCE